MAAPAYQLTKRVAQNPDFVLLPGELALAPDVGACPKSPSPAATVNLGPRVRTSRQHRRVLRIGSIGMLQTSANAPGDPARTATAESGQRVALAAPFGSAASTGSSPPGMAGLHYAVPTRPSAPLD
jgi:hypothetical protein